MTDKKPKESNSITPYLILKDAAKAIEFYKSVFDAKEDFRMDMPDGTLMHAALRIGDSQFMLTEERPNMGKSYAATKSTTYVYVNNPDATHKRAVEKGAKSVMEPDNMFYGDRTACFTDPFGQDWTVALHVEDVSREEVEKRASKLFGDKNKAA